MSAAAEGRADGRDIDLLDGTHADLVGVNIVLARENGNLDALREAKLVDQTFRLLRAAAEFGDVVKGVTGQLGDITGDAAKEAGGILNKILGIFKKN